MSEPCSSSLGKRKSSEPNADECVNKHHKSEEDKKAGSESLAEAIDEKRIKEWKATLPEGAREEERLYLARVNAHPRDKCIAFDDKDHIYFLFAFGSKRITSVTTVLKACWKGFVAEEAIANMKSTHEHYGKPVEVIKEIWKKGGEEASSAGRFMHRTLELFHNLGYDINSAHVFNVGDGHALTEEKSLHRDKEGPGKESKVEKVELKSERKDVVVEEDAELIKSMELVIEFDKGKHLPEFQFHFRRYLEEEVKARGWMSHRTEWRIWDEEHKIAGTIDMVYKRGNERNPKHVILVDWKRLKQLFRFNPFQKGLFPLAHDLDDCNYFKYCLQLNMYRYILQKNYDMIVDEMFIPAFHPIQSDYIFEPVKPMEEHVQRILLYQRNVIDLELE